MKPHTRRRSIRLQNYDYSQPGAYFVTICTYKRECLFGHIEDGVIYYTIFGEIVCQEWSRSDTIRSEIRLDLFVVMPNHLHGIVVITHSDGIVGAHGPGLNPR
jgi:REP element-mobilizing transposase RayT